jgi:hypothetical protein
LHRETKLTLYLFHTSAIVLVRIVGGWRCLCLAWFAIIRSIRVAVRGWLALRARRLGRRHVVWCARCSRLVSLAAFEGKPESTVLVDVWVAALERRLVLVGASSTWSLFRLNNLTLPAIFTAMLVFARSFMLPLARPLLFLSLLAFALFLLALLPVEAKQRRSCTEATSSNLRRARETVVAVLLVIALAVAAAMVPLSVWAVAVAVTVVVFVAPPVLFPLRFLRVLALAVRVLRVHCDVPTKARVSVTSLEAVVASTTVPVCAFSPNSKTSS